MFKHWKYGEHEDLVVSHLKALARLNPAVKLIPDEKVIYNPYSVGDKKVTLVSGGGGGHEPLHAAYVGDNLLDAAVSGAIFASPLRSKLWLPLENQVRKRRDMVH